MLKLLRRVRMRTRMRMRRMRKWRRKQKRRAKHLRKQRWRKCKLICPRLWRRLTRPQRKRLLRSTRHIRNLFRSNRSKRTMTALRKIGLLLRGIDRKRDDEKHSSRPKDIGGRRERRFGRWKNEWRKAGSRKSLSRKVTGRRKGDRSSIPRSQPIQLSAIVCQRLT